MTMCPCCSDRYFNDCCAPIIAGNIAQTAEAVMRSRYTALVMRTLDHIERTHAPEVRDDFNRAEAERLAEECEWKGLRIHSITETDDIAEIGFVMKFFREQKIITKAAFSRFRRERGEWLFVSSKPASHIAHLRGIKIGRNDPCSCDSGKKFKKCCGNSLESHHV